MARRGKRKKAGLTREDAARDRMRDYGFMERVINESIKQLLEVYGEDQWFLIESENYDPLLAICLEKQEELGKQLAEVEQANQLAEKQKEIAQEEQQDEKEQEQDQHLEDERDQADQLSITSEAVMDPSPAALPSAEAAADFAPHSVAVDGMNCGWLSSEEDSDGDDDEMIQLTPEPLCEELEELLKEESGQKKRKKETR